MSLRARTGGLTFDGVEIAWSKADDSGLLPRKVKVPGRELFDATRVGNRIRLRHWQPGDRFQPLGLARPAKVQDLLVNRKVPADRRRELLIATTAVDEIFWVEGLPPGERFKIDRDTRRRLVWTWRRAD